MQALSLHFAHRLAGRATPVAALLALGLLAG